MSNLGFDVDVIKHSFKKLFQYAWIIVILFLAYELYKVTNSKITEYQATRRNAVCPSLLSIGGSARDTLIIMKAEPLCNEFVLQTLK